MSQGKHWFGEGHYKCVLHFRTGVLRIKIDVNPHTLGVSKIKHIAEEYAFNFKDFLTLNY